VDGSGGKQGKAAGDRLVKKENVTLRAGGEKSKGGGDGKEIYRSWEV